MARRPRRFRCLSEDNHPQRILRTCRLRLPRPRNPSTDRGSIRRPWKPARPLRQTPGGDAGTKRPQPSPRRPLTTPASPQRLLPRRDHICQPGQTNTGTTEGDWTGKYAFAEFSAGKSAAGRRRTPGFAGPQKPRSDAYRCSQRWFSQAATTRQQLLGLGLRLFAGRKILLFVFLFFEFFQDAEGIEFLFLLG